ncbi:MAG: hypothetical protein M9911_13120 [Saprospiraceae bacterium]|nr:hypothetical protein [Saprospiraceae bacterium]
MHHQRLPVYHLSLFADRTDGYVDAGFYQKPEPDGQGCFLKWEVAVVAGHRYLLCAGFWSRASDSHNA